ncbi:hypothetical protein IRJ41_007991 [Triplophysa rosa]|uniref:Uncharacterized protein n=1 Tax=Triplophysa rosa TaxID=992332 RepID=A0A9W7WNJ3_TRIRA|nr:hypothetical protein IRJ41_007991 [Triplophysa rosa]
MDFNATLRREATGELTLKPYPEAAALAAAYRKTPTPGRSWPADRVKEEAMARVAAAGGDTGNRQLVLSESALQFGQYRGKTFKWLLSNDAGYAAMVLASHRQERERGDTSVTAVMGNKDALLQYAGLFPDVRAAIQERHVREGSGTPAQEDTLLVGFGNFATLTFKDLYNAVDKERKGFIRWVRQKKDIRQGTKMDALQKYIKRRDAEQTGPKVPETPPPVGPSSSSAGEPSDADLLAAAANVDVTGENDIFTNVFQMMVLETVRYEVYYTFRSRQAVPWLFFPLLPSFFAF